MPGTLARLLPITDTASYALALLVAAFAMLAGVVALSTTTAAATRAVDQEPPVRASMSSSGLPVLIIAMMGLVIMLRIASEGAQRTFFNVYLDEILTMPTAQIGMLAAGVSACRRCRGCC